VITVGPGARAEREGLRFADLVEHAPTTPPPSPGLTWDDLLVLPLHGSLPAEQQTLALRPANRRKVVLATNIAETSLTIDGVRTVVDGGFARVAGYDARRGLDRLELIDRSLCDTAD